MPFLAQMITCASSNPQVSAGASRLLLHAGLPSQNVVAGWGARTYNGEVQGHMYDPSVQRAILHLLLRWRRLPWEDLLRGLSAVDRLRFRPEALRDLEADGLVIIQQRGDEPVVELTPRGSAWLAEQGEQV